MALAALVWVAFACYLEWALIHIFAGSISYYFLTKNDIAGYLSGICQTAPAAIHDEAKKTSTWNPMNIRVLLQHAFNLFTVGVFSVALAILAVTNVNRMSWYLGLWPFVFDIGYFIAVDTVHFGPVPGEAQTYIISVGQICTAIAVKMKYPVGQVEFVVTLAVSGGLIAAGILNKLLHLTTPAIVSPDDN
mmetsp:Transcript_23707/g.72950  ORF Transcript_23707/g.72950 Transcript_23707/m.72950 type:complete len:190 (-) Transcript_23707:289-858(-)|eukprot:CAMPEP_0198667788 /NCGR_PEP_ID=MMETSP1467-20131203/69992_1 /TAXON_ID=1462469 /ORGANISM="unid. sp., Strain CCMP2135" /LENGTH=189 /DNA_ID=CAMNT_0044404499 /DNA_START=89 /DNA_END=658 /DNA_ORIENTATION=+